MSVGLSMSIKELNHERSSKERTREEKGNTSMQLVDQNGHTSHT